MHINLITHNKNKVKEFRYVLEPEIEVNHIDIEYPELRSNDSCEISEASAAQLANTFKKPIVVEDSGFFVEALNGFPGTNSAYIHDKIGLKGILKLMKGVNNRRCYYKSAISYCEPKKKPVSFIGVEEGTVALKEKGRYGWGHDPIFIPKGKKNTYGEIKKKWDDPSLFRKKSILMLKRYLMQN